MSEFEYNKTLGCYMVADVIKPGEDSNYGRCIQATAERLAETKYFRRVYMAQEPDGMSDTEYPYAAVYPDGPPETERTNFSNRKDYNVLVLMVTIDDNPYRGVMRLLAIREMAEDKCRTKDKVQLKDGDFHENTLLDTTPYIMANAEAGTFLFATGFRVQYHVTEPRREE